MFVFSTQGRSSYLICAQRAVAVKPVVGDEGADIGDVIGLYDLVACNIVLGKISQYAPWLVVRLDAHSLVDKQNSATFSSKQPATYITNVEGITVLSREVRVYKDLKSVQTSTTERLH